MKLTNYCKIVITHLKRNKSCATIKLIKILEIQEVDYFLHFYDYHVIACPPNMSIG
jgi:hypothetical protein